MTNERISQLEAEITQLRAESEERLQNCAALVAEVERLRKDAERLQQIAHLIGVILVYGNFVVETYNERVLEKLLRENNTFWESVEQFEQQLTDASKETP